MFIQNVLHESTPRLAGQWLTQMSYKKRLRIQKECGQPYDFCWVADNVGQRQCALIVYVKAMIFRTYNQIMIVINNINKNF